MKELANRMIELNLSLSRILMLVPHEPEEDPRIKWVTDLCTQIGRTDIIGFNYWVDKPAREYNGIVYIERTNVNDYSGKEKTNFVSLKLTGHVLTILVELSKILHWFCSDFRDLRSIVGSKRLGEIGYLTIKYLGLEKSLRPKLKLWKVKILSGVRAEETSRETEPYQETVSQSTLRSSWLNRLAVKLDQQIVVFERFISMLEGYICIIETLFRRARAISIVPQVIICHDIFALAVGVKLKYLFQCPIIYDSHELWPEADLQARNWEKKLTALYERRLIRQADVVITVTPQIARHLEHLYGLTGVLSVPNAEPLTHNFNPANNHPSSFPLKFLLQGRVVPGRGIEELLHLWIQLNDDRVVLIVRAPENEYFTSLQLKFSQAINSGQIVIAPPVTEAELVTVASLADVGIIPYGGPSLNHLYACPNKLSQYMQSGLAILCNADLQFVSEVIGRHHCGLTYDPMKPESLFRIVQLLVDHPEQLQVMKQNAFQGAQSEFNWEVQSLIYKRAIQNFYQQQRPK